MASSSSSSHLIPASISQSWNHDVFLSFRGEDTRKSFVDHLYAALVQKGIHTYKDDVTLARGESIGPSLVKAIQESQIALVIFSENYASSSWCLDELVCIIECMDKRGQIVMPVFYKFDPSHVRKQIGKYEKAFEKHEKESKHKVESWREALVKASNLSGWVTEVFANGHEAKCIKNIVDTISGRLSLRQKNIHKDLIGIETRLFDLKSKLEIGSGGVRVVGIWGVGGGGKTTLACAAYKEISRQFEAHCLLENIRDESSKYGLKRLQETFLSLVLKEEVKLGGEIEGRSMIERKLCHKSVLVVLDDVDNPEQLKALVGSHAWFGEGSRIIITTRDEHLLSRTADKIYEVSLLSRGEAMDLFRRHAYREDEPVEDYGVLSLEVVSYAGGLPLALEILGSFLYDKDKDEWRSVLAKLKCIPDVKVMERLKISYDGLERNVKDLFLDIACYMRGWPEMMAMEVLDACGFHARIGVKVLVQKSLIKVFDGKLDMHDLIEEMAHYIAKGEHPNNPEKHSRIWHNKGIIELCAMEAAIIMENEALDLPIFDHRMSFPLPSYVTDPRLPNVVANMKNLRWIRWKGYPGSSFPTNFQPTKLGYLSLSGSQQIQLWKGSKLLPNLKVLKVDNSVYLIGTPDLSGLPCLETLNLEGCQKLKDIHPSIGYHERLVEVNIDGCLELEYFPPIIRMNNLRTLNISNCSKLKIFPHIQTNMDSLENLDLRYTRIEIIPPSVGQFCTNLVYLNLRYCHWLKRIEGNFRRLKRLKLLQLSRCWRLKKLPVDFFDKECCLEVLILPIKENRINRNGLLGFYLDGPKVPQLPRFLRKLNLSWCHLGNEDIPSDMGELLNLKVLCLKGNKFSRLHSSLARLPSLKILNLSRCKSLVELPDLPSSIAVLKADVCPSLESIGDLSSYKWLWKVSLSGSNERAQRSMFQDRMLHSMLQENVVKDHFMSVKFSLEQQVLSYYHLRNITLQLPNNWHCDFSGFLLCADHYSGASKCVIGIMQERLMDSQSVDNYWEVFDKNTTGSCEWGLVCYLPFVLFRHTPLWNFASSEISFGTDYLKNTKVGLVPKEDSRKTLDCTGSLDEEFKIYKTFTITNKSESHVEIELYF